MIWHLIAAFILGGICGGAATVIVQVIAVSFAMKRGLGA